MATTLSPEQEENKSQIPSEDTPDFLRQRENLDNPDSKDNQPAYNSSDPRGDNAPSTENLNQTEQNGGNPTQHENTIGEGYKPGAGEHHTAPLRSRLLKGRGRKAAVGGSIAALIIVGLIALFIALIPLKILHIVNNLQDRFYSTAQNAVEKQVDNLFSRYLRGKITAGCKGVYIDSSCNPYNGTSFVNRLYRGWSDGRLEEKLRKQTGLEIRKNNLGTYEMKFTGGDTIALDDLKKNKTISEIIDAKGDWTEVKKSQVKGVYKSALKSTTRHASTMYYVKVTPYLAKKFGIKWCVIGCQKGQDFEVWKNKKKFAAKMWLAERVLGPRAELYGMILQCLYAKDEFCSKKSVLEAVSTEYEADTGGCKKGCINNGRHVSPSLQKMEAALVARAASYGSSYAELRKIFEFFEKYGFVGGTLRSILNGINTQGKDKGEQKLKNENELTDKVGKTALQRLGWVVMAAYLVEFINEAPEVMTRLQYEANTAAMAQLWATYRTAPDELKEGEIDAEIYGSFVTSLGPGLQPVDETVIAPENEEEQVGGLAGAEATPLYQAIVSQGSNAPAGVASIINSTLSPQALAAEETSSDYLCKDGNPPPAGKLVCSEEFLNGLGWFGQILKAPEKFVPGWGLIVLASDVITDVIDGIIGKIFDIIGSFLPGFIKDALADAAGEIANLLGQLARFAELDAALKAFAEWMLGLNLNMVSNNMSGGRTFNMVAAGADVSGNDYAHHGIGGVTLTPEQVAQNLDYSKQSQLAEYQQKSFFARILDTESPYSPASKLALAMPSNTTAALNNINGAFATFIKNPFGKLFNSFASIFTLHTNAAGFIPGKDPFGITQYGYPLDDPVFNQDPDQYWQTYCTTEEGKYNLTKDWNEYAAKNLNEDNFEPENLQTNFFASKVPGNKYGTNGCLLIQAAVGSAGAIFTDDVLSAEELASLSSSSGGGGSGGACDLGTDFSPSQPDKFAEAIAQYAPGLSRPECVEQNPQIKEFCSKAVPNDCKRQYFRAYALVNPDGNAACDGKDLADAGGSKYPGRKCIGVKYGDPPVGSNTIAVPVD